MSARQNPIEAWESPEPLRGWTGTTTAPTYGTTINFGSLDLRSMKPVKLPLEKEIKLMLYIPGVYCPDCGGGIFYSVKFTEHMRYNRWTKYLQFKEDQDINTLNHKGIKRILLSIYEMRHTYIHNPMNRFASISWVIRCNGCELHPDLNKFEKNDLQYYLHVNRILNGRIVQIHSTIYDPNELPTPTTYSRPTPTNPISFSDLLEAERTRDRISPVELIPLEEDEEEAEEDE